MAVPQAKYREMVLQILYAADLDSISLEGMTNLMMKELRVPRKAVRSAMERVEDIREKSQELDAMIRERSKEYEFDRIRTVEINVLRLGLFELIYDESIPDRVALSEAVRLAKKFSTPEAAKFVNAILDGIYQKRKNEEDSC